MLDSSAYRGYGGTASYARLPLGVAILSILIGIFGFFVLAAGLLLLFLGAGTGFAAGASVFGFTGLVAGVVTVIVGFVTLAVAAGLWDQELWALALAVIVLIFYGAIEFFAGAWLGFVVVAGLLAYLIAVSPNFD